MNESIGVGIVGYGAMYSMGRHHSDQIHATEGLHLTAVYDILPERRQAAATEQPSAEIHESLESLLEDPQVDAVVIVTPHDSHCPLSVQASRAGKHVLVEKAMCLSVNEADEMITAAEAAGRALSVYQNRRWDGDYLTVRDIVRSGELGEVFQVESSVNGFFYPDGWRGVRAHGGGMIYDWGAHLFDQILCLLRPAKPESVYAVAHKRVHDVDIDTQHTVIVRFDNGTTAEIDVGCISHVSRPRWLVRGEKNALLMPDWNTAFLGKESVPLRESEWGAAYRQFARHLTLGEDLEVKPKEVREAIRLIEAAQESAASGEAVRLTGTT